MSRNLAPSRTYAAASFAVNGFVIWSNVSFPRGYPGAGEFGPRYRSAPAHRVILRRGWDY